MLVVTCEHASNAVPRDLRPLFKSAGAALRSHRGWDRGAPPLARALSSAFHTPVFMGEWSRLVVDLNRSPGRPAVFSRFTRGLDDVRRALLVDRLHAPHWQAVRGEIEREIDAAGAGGGHGVVLHLGVHSFTPVLRGVRRTADFALLYDPQRPLEKSLCDLWLRALAARAPSLRLRRNYPYLGTADGLTTALRKRFGPDQYAGIEIEINQALLGGESRLPAAMQRAMVDSLRGALGALDEVT